MFLTVHATTAILITQRIANPWLAFLICFVSHFILDAIPHGDDELFHNYSDKKRIAAIGLLGMLDLGIGIGIFFWMISAHIVPFNGITLAAISGSVLPDVLSWIYMIIRFKPFAWNYHLNRMAHSALFKNPLPMAQGFLVQAVFFGLLISALVIR